MSPARAGLKVVGFLSMCFGAVMAAAVLTGMFLPAWALRDGQPWPVMALAALLIIAGTAVFRRRLPRVHGFRLFAVGLAGGMVLVGGLAWLLMLAGVLHWQPNKPFTTTLMLSGTAYFMFAVLVEELAFRGYALRRLAEGIGATAAVVVMAAVFGGYHLLSIGASPAVKDGGLDLIWVAAGPLIGALVFGLAALRTGGIALPLGLHLGWNWTQWHFFTFPGDDNPTGLFTPLVVVDGPAPFRIGYLVAMTAALVAVAAMTRVRLRPGPLAG